MNCSNGWFRNLRDALYRAVQTRSPRWAYLINDPKNAILQSRYFSRYYDYKTSHTAPPIEQRHFDHYLSPQELSSAQQTLPRVLVLGQCVSVELVNNFIKHGLETDSLIFGYGQSIPRRIEDYGFIVCHPPFRSVLPDFALARLRYDDEAGHQELFAHSEALLTSILKEYLAYNDKSGALTFLLTFFTPQQNMYGRLLPRFDLRNSIYFVEQLNKVIFDAAAQRKNVHVIDINQIAAVFGKKYIQDDVAWWLSHGAFLDDEYTYLDLNRISKIHKTTKYYPAKPTEFLDAVREEILAAYKTISQVQMVKLVITDLDDTLWRGVLADGAAEEPHPISGWPMGYAEALLILKSRGILLGIVSKNTEDYVTSKWNDIFLGKLKLEDFAFLKINWLPKSENIAEILSDANLLPGSTVFIDDNPVEQAAVSERFPDMRILGTHPHLLRRILLWSSETQVASISAESTARTDLVKAQVVRNRDQERMGHQEFLDSLKVQVSGEWIDSVQHKKFSRAIELINKTNQFNTTGRRWSHEECLAHFSSGNSFAVFNVKDKYADYGITGVIILSGSNINQFVMSCRIIGLKAEKEMIDFVLGACRNQGRRTVTAEVKETDKNFISRAVFKDNNFHDAGDRWVMRLD